MGSRSGGIGDTERRAERRSLDEPARLRPNSWSSVEVRLADISELGFRASCEARLQVGGAVSLEVPGVGPVDAQVEWQRGGEFGARFLAPLALDRCGWPVGEGNATLASLLYQRAGAHQVGRRSADAALRRRILSALPVRRGGAAA
ncbi:MAG: hypothetical protein JO013_07905 [Alphaproteobacteria bacterium]|nr:hypothetical protein [Alphaproteobacteria bacterium]